MRFELEEDGRKYKCEIMPAIAAKHPYYLDVKMTNCFGSFEVLLILKQIKFNG
jgi:hypothetical protein